MYFCKLFDGARHDSADPFEWGEKHDRALPQKPRRPAHQDADLSDQLSLPAGNRHRAAASSGAATPRSASAPI
jgi:nicotinic acid phosphoribosyltransferase